MSKLRFSTAVFKHFPHLFFSSHFLCSNAPNPTKKKKERNKKKKNFLPDPTPAQKFPTLRTHVKEFRICVKFIHGWFSHCGREACGTDHVYSQFIDLSILENTALQFL